MVSTSIQAAAGIWGGCNQVARANPHLKLALDLFAQIVKLGRRLVRKHLGHVGTHCGIERGRGADLNAVPTTPLHFGDMVLAQGAQSDPEAPPCRVKLRAPTDVLKELT